VPLLDVGHKELEELLHFLLNIFSLLKVILCLEVLVVHKVAIDVHELVPERPAAIRVLLGDSTVDTVINDFVIFLVFKGEKKRPDMFLVDVFQLFGFDFKQLEHIVDQREELLSIASDVLRGLVEDVRLHFDLKSLAETPYFDDFLILFAMFPKLELRDLLFRLEFLLL